MKGSVVVDRQFFVKERNNYSNWGLAFWRELFQNSCDADATKIDIQLLKDEDGMDRIVFTDNGFGMSRDVLLNTFFRLGATTKNTGTSTGGFGKARILICWSHPEYIIRSADFICRGNGSEYEIEDAENIKGCKFEIKVDCNDRYNRQISLKDSLKQYLSASHLTCVLTSNDPEINNWKNWLYRRRLTRDLGFGRVYVNKSAISNTVYVRVDGALMFTCYSSAGSQIILEITKESSRNVLLSNRDSLHSEFQSQLDRFLQEVAVDKQSALKDPIRRETHVFSNSKMTTKRRKASEEETINPYGSNVTQEDFCLDQASALTDCSNRKALAAAVLNVPALSGSMFANNIEERFNSDTVTDDPMIASMVVDVETENPNLKKVVSRYRPDNWKMDTRNGKTFRIGGNCMKLIKLWGITCDMIFQDYLDIVNSDSIEWKPGFVFADKPDGSVTEGCHKIMDGAHVIMLNPCDFNGNLRWRLRSDTDRSYLITIAAHEIAHCSYGPHDEAYANLFTTLVARAMSRKKEIVRALGDFLAG